ncbi:acetyl-CoA carboxylase biotin carboxyl carrier protein subunit [bacterium CG_4_9_14_3_um_filter_65_15]|nr:MAG: acetyl-CoA carboxylase biotin carboxyl carrier protein subunit [bacterium CG_4_9_14_3_um_filter_65_15]
MKLKITVHGVAYEVDVEVLDAKDEMLNGSPSPLPDMAQAGSLPPVAPAGALAPRPVAAGPSAAPGGAGSVTSPIAGTVLEVKCKPGDQVTQGQALLVIEAMKMETTIAAPVAGKVKNVAVAAGDAVRESETLVEFE